MLISYILSTFMIISTMGKKCDEIRCSNIIDKVCAIAEIRNHTSRKLVFQNICYIRKAACEEESFVELNQVENEVCGLTTRRFETTADNNQDGGTRRVTNFGIVGSHQACEHTCPIACTDAYEPACAIIWNEMKTSFTVKTMLNHCHIDMFSCATGLHVNIDHLSRCLPNSLKIKLPFIKSAAAMKSLGLLSDDLEDYGPQNKRRTNVATPVEDDADSLKNHLKEVVRRLFDKYRKVN